MNPSQTPLSRPGQRPPLVLTMGDPAGIGPEIVARAMAGFTDQGWAQRAVVAGDLATLQRAAAMVAAAGGFVLVAAPVGPMLLGAILGGLMS